MPDAVIICPIEYGVIATPFGTIAPGTIIAAIAASPESVDPPGILKGFMPPGIREFQK